MTSMGVAPLGWEYDDGGRAAAGFRGDAGDCVPRAIAIATGVPYREVYDDLFELARADEARCRKKTRSGPSPRSGVHRKVYERYLLDRGWLWVPQMSIGSGCRVHLRRGEVPDEGIIIASLSRHVATVIDGVIHDTHDPTRGGDRCVYGWYEPGANALAVSG